MIEVDILPPLPFPTVQHLYRTDRRQKRGILYFDELNSAKDYTFADIGNSPSQTRRHPGKTFSGWKIEVEPHMSI